MKNLRNIEQVRQWVYDEKQRLEGRVMEKGLTIQEYHSLGGSFLTIQKLIQALEGR